MAAEEVISHLRKLPNQARQQYCEQLEQQVPLPLEQLGDRMLTWEQIRTMHRAGLSFGSHTLTHPVISRLEPALLEHELLESKKFLEKRIGSAVHDFAYPFGKREDCGVIPSALERYGYRSAATTVWGLNIPGINPYELRRVSIGEERSLGMFAFKLARLFLSGEASSREAVSVLTAEATSQSAFN